MSDQAGRGAVRSRPASARRPPPLSSVGAVRAQVAVLAMLGAGALVAARPAFTTITGYDVVLAALAGAALVVGAAGASPTVLILAADVAALASTGLARPVAVGGLVIAVGLAYTGRRSRRLTALVGWTVVVGLADLPAGRPLAVAVVAPVAIGLLILASWYRGAPSQARRRARRALLAGALATGAFAGVAAVGLVTARASLQRGLDHAQEGMTATRDIDTERAAEAFSLAEADFAAAEDALGAWWARPAELLPGVRPQLEVLRVLARSAATVTRAGEASLARGVADVLRFRDGAVDLAAVELALEPVRQLLGVVEGAREALDDAGSPWLLSPVAASRDRLRERLVDASDSLELAGAVLTAAPELFGRDAPRRYLIAFVTPVEARGRTGFMGNYGVVTATGGRLELTEFGDTVELERSRGDSPPPPLRGPADYVARYGQFHPEETLRNVSMSPDFPSVASVLSDLWVGYGGAPVDAVVSVDPRALAGFLQLTGPVRVPDLGRLTAANAAQKLLLDQYLELRPRQRSDFLAAAARETFELVDSLQAETARDVARALQEPIRNGYLVAWSPEAGLQRLFQQLAMDGALPPVSGDAFAVVNNNAAGSKIDLFLHRTIDYDVVFDHRTGAVEGTLTVSFTNDAPPAGLADIVIGNLVVVPEGAAPLPTGTNRTLVTVYSPFELVSASLDGAGTELSAQPELGRFAYSTALDIAPGATAVLRLELAGVIDLPEYRLVAATQPLVRPDDLHLQVRLGSVDDAGDEPPPVSFSTRVVLDRTLEFVVAPD